MKHASPITSRLSVRATTLTPDQLLELESMERALDELGVQVTPPTAPGEPCTVEYLFKGSRMFSVMDMERLKAEHRDEVQALNDRIDAAMEALAPDRVIPW